MEKEVCSFSTLLVIDFADDSGNTGCEEVHELLWLQERTERNQSEVGLSEELSFVQSADAEVICLLLAPPTPPLLSKVQLQKDS